MKISSRKLARYAADRLQNGAGTAEVARELAAAIVAGKRQKEVELLMSDIALELERRREFIYARVTTAAPLNEKLRAEIAKFVKQATLAKAVRLEEKVEKSTLGGIKIETSARLWDKTLANSLAEIREVF